MWRAHLYTGGENLRQNYKKTTQWRAKCCSAALVYFFYTFFATVGVCVFKSLVFFLLSRRYSMYMFPPQACVGDEPALHRMSNVPHCELCLCLQIHKARLSRLLFRDAFVCSAYNQVKRPPRALSEVFSLFCESPKNRKKNRRTELD